MPTNKKHLGELKDEFTIKNIGSTLLHELAKGLYQPDEVIREYVANAVDAHRSWLSATGSDTGQPVQIELRPNAISILDYGIGMDDKEIKEVKSIAVSRKSSSDIRLTGHKGVGIWAGLSFFERIIMYTTKKGSGEGFELTIEFKRIVDSIGDDKDIGNVLNPNFRIDRYEESLDEHYTTVTLEAPTRDGDQFLDPEFVTDAVRKICPCEVDPTFALHDELAKWYAENGIVVFPIHVDGNSVYRSYPSSVEGFATGTITVDDKPVATFWHAINKTNSVLAARDDQLIGYRLEVDGFALGRENPYSDTRLPGYDDLKIQQYLEWHIGEIYVITPDLRPNLKRNQFEESEPARRFIGKLRFWYRDVEQDTRLTQEKRNRLKDYEDYEIRLQELLTKRENEGLSTEDVEWVAKKIDDLTSQEQKAHGAKTKNRSLDPKVAALRVVARERRKLLASLSSLVPQKGTFPGTSEDSPGDGAGTGSTTSTTEGSAGRQSGTGQTSGETASEQEDAEAPSSGEGDSGDGEGSGLSAPIQVILALAAEVIAEEFPENPERVRVIMTRLRGRVEQVLAAGQVLPNG